MIHPRNLTASSAGTARLSPPARFAALGLSAALALGLFGCGQTVDEPTQTEGEALALSSPQGNQDCEDPYALVADVAAMDFDYTDRDRDASYDEAAAAKADLSTGAVSGDGISVADGTWTVSRAGTYLFTGTADQGRIVVDADKDADKVQIVLAGVSLTNADGPAIQVESADKVFVTLAEGTENTLVGGGTSVAADAAGAVPAAEADGTGTAASGQGAAEAEAAAATGAAEAASAVDAAAAQATDGAQAQNGADAAAADDDSGYNACLYSSDDLTINGSGSLIIQSPGAHGIKSTDDLVIADGTLTVAAAGDGIRGKDALKIGGGTVTVTSGDDALAATNGTENSRGYVSITDGTLNLTAADKAIDAEFYLRQTGGAVTATAGDDGYHSNGDMRVAGGSAVITAGDDGLHADFALAVEGGRIEAIESVEGLEGQQVYITGGEVSVAATDDGINASAPDIDAESRRNGQSAPESTTADGADAAAADGGAQGPDQGDIRDMPEQLPEGAEPPAAPPDGAMQRPQDAPDDADIMLLDEADGAGQDPAASSEGAPAREGQGGAGKPGGRGFKGEDSADAGDGARMPQDGTGRPADGEEPAGNGERMPQGDPGAYGEDANFAEGERPAKPEGYFGGRGGGAPADYEEGCLVQITGGTVTVDASGDGIDSNGDFELGGGAVYVSGPDNSGNGALDYERNAYALGGTLIATGARGMALSFSGGTQPFAMVDIQGAAGDTVTLFDPEGEEAASFQPAKAFQCAVITAPGMEEGETYTVTVTGASQARAEAEVSTSAAATAGRAGRF